MNSNDNNSNSHDIRGLPPPPSFYNMNNSNNNNNDNNISFDKKELKQKLIRFYQFYNPSKLENKQLINEILKRYEDNPTQMMIDLQTKYNLVTNTQQNRLSQVTETSEYSQQFLNDNYKSIKRRGSIILPKNIFTSDKSTLNKQKWDSYTLDEIKQHNNIESCWIIVNRYILDVTQFLKYHPIGYDSILNKAGMNCDNDYKMHSKMAQKLFWKFVVGKLK